MAWSVAMVMSAALVRSPAMATAPGERGEVRGRGAQQPDRDRTEGLTDLRD
jgi:hypothetical protein